MLEERKRILRMVEEGKLTIDEALILLDELGTTQDAMKKKEEELLGELSTFVKFEEAKKGDESSHYKFQSTKDKIFDFLENALKKIKDFDLDFNFGQSVDLSHIFQQTNVHLDELDIDIANGSAKLIPWNQPDVRIECDAKVYRVETQEEARTALLKDVLFAIEGNKLRFSTQQKWLKMSALIYIPQAQYENVKIRMFNGSIESENVHASVYKAKTANGKILIDQLKGRYVELETANGQIEVLNAKVKDFDAESINGAIKINGAFEKLDVQTFNGNIVCTVTDELINEIEAKSTTGNIQLYVPENRSLEGSLTSNLGSFNIDVKGMQVVEEKNDIVQKQLRFRTQFQQVQAAKLEAGTTTGSITIKAGSPEVVNK